MPFEVAPVLLIVIVGLSIVLMLARPRNIAEVWWVCSGACLLVVLHLLPVRLALRAVGKGTDVYLFLAGMMLLSALADENGVFEWVSSCEVRDARGQCTRLFWLVYAIGTLVTVCMSNDATAVVLTPAVLSVVRKAKVEPRPYLFACAMIANAASFVLPISNPANLVVFQYGMPPLARWLISFGVPSLLSIAATYLVLRVLFRSELSERIDCKLEEKPLGQNGRLVLWGLVLVVFALLTASSLRIDLGLPTFLVAVLVTVTIAVKRKSNPLQLAKEISWSTLVLVAGLFILVEALESIGALRYTQAALVWAQHLPVGTGALVVSFFVGIFNNVVNNLPLGLVVGATVQTAHAKDVLTNALLIGVDLGPNLSVTGSLATILWLLALRKEGLRVSAWDFFKVGVVAMPVAMLAAVSGLLLIHGVAGK